MVPWYCKCVCRIFWIVPFVVSQENDKILQKMPKVKKITIYVRIIISTCCNESNIFFMLRDKKWLFSEWYFWIGLLWCIKVSKFLKIYFLMVICLIISSVIILMPGPSTGPKMLWAGPIFFVLDQILIYILRRSQTFCARLKDNFHWVNLVFVPPQNFWNSTKSNSIFGLAQTIWTVTKHFGTCRRTRHKGL